jgi:hypothetical protein
MIGVYRIYENGTLVAEIPNSVTTEGKGIITRFLARNNTGWAGAMAVGSGRVTAAAASNTALDNEYARFPVYYSYGYYDGAYKIVFKAAITETFAGSIEEIGLYPRMANDNAAFSGTLSTFNNENEWTVTGLTVANQYGIAAVSSTASSRVKVGDAGLKLTSTGNLFKTLSDINFANYAPSDRFALAYGLDAAQATFSIRFEKDASNYFTTGNFANGTLNSYNIQSFAKSACTQTGTLTWADVNSIRVVVGTNTGGLYLDCLRPVVINHFNPDYGLVSRAVNGGAEDSLITRLGSKMDLEYEVTFNL